MNDITLRNILHDLVSYISIRLCRLDPKSKYKEDKLKRLHLVYKVIYSISSVCILFVSTLIISVAAKLAEILIK